MENGELLQQNCKRWRVFSPEWADELLKTSVDDKIQPSEDELSQLAAEANESIKSVSKKASVIYACSVRGGVYYTALKEWLSGENNYLVLLDPDLKEIALLLSTQLGKEILWHPRVYLFYVDPIMKSLELPVALFLGMSHEVIGLSCCHKNKFEYLENLKKRVDFLDSLHAPTVAEFQDLGSVFFYNYFHNIFKWPNSSLADKLFKKFSNVPAIICGAGPSLQKNGHKLQELRDRALIFAGGTAMNAVNAQGAMPHFGVGIDPNISQVTRIIMNNAFEVPFFYRNRMFAPALRLIHGPLLNITGSSGYEIAKYFDREFDLSTDYLTEGFNVVNFSMAIAMALGCNPIIFVGLDLAYSNDISYAPGILQHPIHERREFFKTKSDYEELLQRNDIYGQPISTLWKWANESLWLSSFAFSNKETTIINATEGGIGFSLVPNMTLKDVEEQYLQQQFDLDLRIFSEMQDAKMPEKVSFENIIAALEKLMSSLEKSSEMLLEISNGINNTGNVDKDLQKQLELEDGYQYVLNEFNGYYERIKKRAYWRLEIDKEQMSEDAFSQEKKTLDIQKYYLLNRVAENTINHIRNVIAEEKEQELKVFEHHKKIQVDECCPIPPIGAGEHYRCDQQCFILIDPEFALHHEENFSNDNKITIDRTYYQSGALCQENFKRDQNLHGSSSYYSEDGFLLGQSFYIDGIRQGKATRHYKSKALAALQGFKDGAFEGVQLFFYDNGTKRSLINYSKGQLHGEVLLYYSNGQIARELHFTNGMREGVERLWTEDGVLIIEAHFNKNLPVGLARAWHDNGCLAYENDYGSDGSKVSEVKTWDKQGNLLGKREDIKDYFKDAAKETEFLTANILNIFQQASLVAPLLEKVGKEENTSIGEVEKSLALVNAEIENLKKIGKEISFNSGLDPSNTAEGFWKTPSMQRSIEAQIEQMTEQINSEINKLKDSLAHVMAEAAKKLDADEKKKK